MSVKLAKLLRCLSLCQANLTVLVDKKGMKKGMKYYFLPLILRGDTTPSDTRCTHLQSVFTWKLILDPPFGSTICLSISLFVCIFGCMVSGIFFCGEAGEGGLSEYGSSMTSPVL